MILCLSLRLEYAPHPTSSTILFGKLILTSNRLRVPVFSEALGQSEGCLLLTVPWEVHLFLTACLLICKTGEQPLPLCSNLHDTPSTRLSPRCLQKG